MRHNYAIQYSSVLLRPLLGRDIEFLRTWRNNSDSSKYIRNIGYISEDKQRQWYLKYLENPNEITFAIVELNELHRIVGSVSLYDIDYEKKQAEIGKILIGDSEAHGKGIGRISLVMLMEFAFKKLGLKRIYAGVNRENVAARKNDLKIGFKIVGEHPSVSAFGGVEDEIEIDQIVLETVNSYAKDINLGAGYEE